MEEARAGVRRLRAVHTVELRRMPDRLVHLQLHLLVVDDAVHHARWTDRRGQQRRRLLRDARRLALEAECDDVLPTRLRTRAAVRARVAAKLRHAVPDGHRVDAAAALDVL